jgi:hypothetical protein
VYEISYDRCDTNKLQILAYSTCGPIKAEVTTQYGRYTLGISSTQPLLTEEPKKIVLGANISSELESFNIMIKDKRDSFTDRIILNQCSATKSYSHTTGYTSEQQSPIFYGSYDEEMMQQDMSVEIGSVDVVETTPDGVIVDPEPDGTIEEPATLMTDPEPTDVMVDPEPTEIKQNVLVDPEPEEIKPSKNSKNNLFEMLFKSFSRIFQK